MSYVSLMISSHMHANARYNCLFPVALAGLYGDDMLPLVFPLIFGPAFGLGSLLLSALVYGGSYDAALERHGLDVSQPCPYADCYVPAMLTGAAACAAAALLFVLIAHWTRAHGVLLAAGKPWKENASRGGLL